jgi:hypothetical protein
VTTLAAPMIPPTPIPLVDDVSRAARAQTLARVRAIIETTRKHTARQPHMSGCVMQEVDAALNNVLGAMLELDP